MIGRTLGGATVAMMQGTLVLVVCLIAGFRPVSVLAALLAFLLMALIAVVFAALGDGHRLDAEGHAGLPDGHELPGDADLLSVRRAVPAARAAAGAGGATRVDPLSYGIDGLRGVLIGTAHFGVAFDVVVLLGVGVLFVAAGAWRFSKIEA